MSIRKEFVLKVLARDASVVKLCREYGVSRKTAYKWLRRFQERGIDGLVDETSRPGRSLEMLRLRQKHPTWGCPCRILIRESPGRQGLCMILARELLASRRARGSDTLDG